jgi:acetyltransferase-like isoleucine patch superfamily enzyme
MDRRKLLAELKNAPVGELFELLNELRDILQQGFMQQYDRSLPFGDLLFDRWRRAEMLGFGKGTSVYDSSVILGKVKVGENTWIGPNTVLDGSGGLQIGSHCSISAGVQIYSHDSVNWAITGGGENYEYGLTTIGDNCYIGPNAVIVRGITLGNGCIVGANSLVNRSYGDGVKIVGSPARPI